MDENRLQAYQNLIQDLLSCSSGEEAEILSANSELVDAGLVEAIAQVVEIMEQRGDHYGANFLIGVARLLAESLKVSSTPIKQLRLELFTLT